MANVTGGARVDDVNAAVPGDLHVVVPGVFACIDMRFGPIKRVAAAVGEGSTAIAFVYAHPKEGGRQAEASELEQAPFGLEPARLARPLPASFPPPTMFIATPASRRALKPAKSRPRLGSW